MQPNFISYPIIKFLAEESEKEPKKNNKPYDWITIIYDTFFQLDMKQINKKKHKEYTA